MIYKYFISTKKEVFIRALFYFSLILFGLNFYKDFGVSMDDIGYKFVANKDYNFIKLLINNFGENKFDEIVRDYSAKIETISTLFFLIVFFINDLSGLDTTIISKLLLFFFFISGCHLIFLIIDKRFNNKILSYLAVLFLFSSPRIFSEAFINSRDIFYLILFIVNLYLVQKIFYEFSYKNLLYLSSIIGISLNVRIFELVFIIILIFFLIIEYENKIKKKELFFKIFFLIFFSFVFLFIVTPYLWVTSLDNFINLFFYDLSVTGSIKVTNQFLGKLYASTNTPWYYYITWILFTNPILFLLLSLGGGTIILYKFFFKFLCMNFNQKFWISKDEMFDYFIFFNLIFFLFIISRFSMSNFDGWRHVYFVYPLIIINSIYFLNKINQNNLLYFKILLIILSINILLNLQWIFKNHPFQYTYFNILNDFNKSKGFDYDYHGVSNYNAFLFIYSDSNKSKSTVGTISYNNLSANHQILPNQIKNSIEITSIENGLPNYLIDNYRIPYKKEKTIFLKEKLENYSKIKDFKVDRNIISTIYKKK